MQFDDQVAAFLGRMRRERDEVTARLRAQIAAIERECEGRCRPLRAALRELEAPPPARRGPPRGEEEGEEGVDSVRTIVELRQDIGALGAILGVDVCWSDEALFPERLVEGHAATQESQANIGNAHARAGYLLDPRTSSPSVSPKLRTRLDE